MTTYGIANGNGPIHILKPNGTAYCGVRRVHPFRRPGPQRIHRRCELLHARALAAIPPTPPKTPQQLDTERRQIRNHLADVAWQHGIVI